MARMCYLCGNKVDKNKKISLHKFPIKTPVCSHMPNALDIHRLWLDVCGLSDIDDVSHILVCSCHFDPNEIRTILNKAKLVPGAVPSIGVPNPAALVDYKVSPINNINSVIYDIPSTSRNSNIDLGTAQSTNVASSGEEQSSTSRKIKLTALSSQKTFSHIPEVTQESGDTIMEISSHIKVEPDLEASTEYSNLYQENEEITVDNIKIEPGVDPLLQTVENGNCQQEEKVQISDIKIEPDFNPMPLPENVCIEKVLISDIKIEPEFNPMPLPENVYIEKEMIHSIKLEPDLHLSSPSADNENCNAKQFRMPKTSTERVRKFRARQRQKKQQEGQNAQHGGQRQGAGRPRGTRTAADRSRDYRQRLKERREHEYFMEESIKNESGNSMPFAQNTNGLHRQTIAERMREIHLVNPHQDERITVEASRAKRRKTEAERLREYRARKKSEITQNAPVKPRKTAAQRMREYRARKKSKLTQNENDLHRKTISERMREYRARKKSKITQNAPVKPRKTAAERMREYRARKKSKMIQNASVKPRKTAAERMREYRARKKNKKIQAANDFFSIIYPPDVVIEMSTTAIAPEPILLSNIKMLNVEKQQQ